MFIFDLRFTILNKSLTIMCINHNRFNLSFQFYELCLCLHVLVEINPLLSVKFDFSNNNLNFINMNKQIFVFCHFFMELLEYLNMVYFPS